MVVLSLFDGPSTGLAALKDAGIKVDKYFASEIDPHAIKVSAKNHPEVVQVGSVEDLFYKDGCLFTGKWDADTRSYRDVQFIYNGVIDLLIGGSPCQGFSKSGKNLGFDDPRSRLFWHYARIMYEVGPKWFLLENVKMKKEWRDIISEELNIEPILLNSSLLSAQNRERYYWANWKITPPADRGIVLAEVLQDQVDRSLRVPNIRPYVIRRRGVKHVRPCAIRGRYNSEGVTEQRLEVREDVKANAVTTVSKDSLVMVSETVRRYSITELERLQTLPDGYTEGVSETQRRKMIGNGWTMKMISEIFSQMC
ncbi:MAG: DNA cytosine methyltransferase [Candidatus Saccharibacteria bacterium]|nr:DNA cytosine methyltransferase [Candidatus Saccharibacteria bacterium]